MKIKINNNSMNIGELHIDLNTILSIVGVLITGIVGPIVLVRYKQNVYKNNTNFRKQEEFNLALKNQSTINESLNNLQETLDINRILITQFHNGGNFWPGNQSMKKMSVTYESTSRGTAADILKIQNVPVSFFSGILQDLISATQPVFLNIKEIKDNALRYFWENRGVELVYLFPILGLDNLLLGILIVEQTNEHLTLSETSIHILSDEAKKLSGYIVYNSVASI
jgi:hypothetical protein